MTDFDRAAAEIRAECARMGWVYEGMAEHLADAILALETSHPDARYEWVSMSLADIRVPDDEWERVYGARAREMMEADILEPRATDAIGRAARD